MKILGYQSQMGIQNASGGQSGGYQHPSAFMKAGQERLPHDLNNLSKGLSQLGGAMHEISIQERQAQFDLDLINDIQGALAQDSTNRHELQEQFRGPGARGVIDEYNKRSQSIMGELTTKYKNNPAALHHISSRLGTTFNAGTNALRGYSREQEDAYQGGLIDQQISILNEVYSNPASSGEQKSQAIKDYSNLRRNQLIRNGWDMKSAQRQVVDDIKALDAQHTLNELDHLQKTNPIEGLKMMDGALSGDVETPRGIRNNNPGNIVKTSSAWDGEVEGKDDRFKSFATPEHGIAAVSKNLLSYGDKGINTVAGIIHRWAPPHENNTKAYIKQVSQSLGVDSRFELDLKNPAILTALTGAIIQHENGGIPYSSEQIDAGVNAALGKAPLPDSLSKNKPEGLVTAGNIDLKDRPVVKNDDGTISTVRSISFNEDGKEILIPTVSDNGKLLSDDEAIDLYHNTGKHLGVFKDAESASLYAEQLHTDQESFYSDGSSAVKYEAWLPTKIAQLKNSLSPQQILEKRAGMAVAAEKQEQQNFIQKYSGLPPAEAVLAVANDPELIARPDLQKKVLNHFDLMEAAGARATKAKEVALKGQLVENIEKVDLNAPDSSRQFEKIISDAPYPMQAELTKIAMGRVTGEDKISDPVAADEAETRILAGESVNIRGEYGGKLNLVTQRRLEKLQSSAEFKEFVIKEKALFEAELDKYSKTRNLTKTKRSDLYHQYEASIPEGGFKDIAQRQKAFNLFWRSVTVDKNWALEKEIRGYQERDYAEKGYYPSTGAAFKEIYDMTKAQIKAREGVEREPDEKELLNVYQSALGITKGDK